MAKTSQSLFTLTSQGLLLEVDVFVGSVVIDDHLTRILWQKLLRVYIMQHLYLIKINLLSIREITCYSNDINNVLYSIFNFKYK